MIKELNQATRLFKKALRAAKAGLGGNAAAAKAIKDGDLFDAEFYRQQCPRGVGPGTDLLQHYLSVGWKLGLEPSPRFSAVAYMGRNADVRKFNLNPLLHWVRFGRAERRILPESAGPEYIWADAQRGGAYPLPDDVIQYELLAGRAYFASAGFDFEQREAGGTAAEAVQAMAARTPACPIDTVAPKVSIIIPVYGQTHYVLNCLDSLARLRTRHSVEIIVADDVSPAGSQSELLAGIPWIRYERRAENGGFLECCNSTAQKARGEFVVLLNSDTRVAEGWLDELLMAFDLFPKAGMVGSKLFNADGTLQEAGGIFWRDGSAHNYGRDEDPNLPQYCFARQADFISGASIALRKRVWEEMSGFDPEYKPAYCEDADLAFRLRRAGHEVWYVPTSRVVHYEGITHGRDTTKGIKAYQVTNMQKLARRFSAELGAHPQPGSDSRRAATWRHRRSMLFVDALTPTPDQDSGSVVTHEVMSAYRDAGFAESFFPQHSPYWSKKYTSALQRRGVCCYYKPYAEDVGKLLDIDNAFDYAILYRYNVAHPAYMDLREKAPSTRLLFANVDLHYLRETRAAETAGNPQALFPALVTKKKELEMFVQADASFVHTDIEKEVIQKALPRPLDNMVVLPWISEVFRDTPEMDGRSDIMFLGNFPHAPNVDSIMYFMASIWPALQHELPPHAKLLVVGNKPPPEVLALASERVVVTGFVEDLAPYFERSRVFVAPLRYGAGIKGKLVMALAHGVPSVASTIAAEGIAKTGETHLAVADEPAQFAAEVLRVYGDAASWRRMREDGLAYVEQNYSRIATLKICLEALDIADRTWLLRQELQCRRSLEKIMAENSEYRPAEAS
ncbi:Glycosyltransferase, GT2 family [Variovorax sp. PDC80]|uniref:glycosyltransferase n=1 Tax=Variovorax sp. PDC80 TaxID=1882827 RepID=UPI0008E87C9F|nr:glycosyltransferase [Variovorax sp. PDC80]SFP89995.1 Glycosyltransferase, GT2 family [Variovorax sp. PDC80]